MRIHGNTMPTQTGAGEKRHESEGLVAALLPLPRSKFRPSDRTIAPTRSGAHIDGAKDVFQQFLHLGHSGRRNRVHLFAHLLHGQHSQLRAGPGNPSHHNRGVRRSELRVARIDSLGRKRQEIIAACYKTIRPDRLLLRCSSKGCTNSSVVPGYVVLFNTINCPGRRRCPRRPPPTRYVAFRDFFR